jgi:PHD/YefM family antitoxin component YafN of YafNO toxin-antitoxin module
MNVYQLPDEIMRMIFLYLQSPEAKMIKDQVKKDQVKIYETDHNEHEGIIFTDEDDII